MSFRTFIYYCALCGGWAAFLVWLVVNVAGILSLSPYSATALVAGILGVFLGGAVGGLDALLNAVGTQHFLRVLVCVGVGLLGGLVSGLFGEFLHQKLHIPLFIGWTLVGVVIGAAIGVFDVIRALGAREDLSIPRRKVLNGLLGGLVGGLAGGLLFDGLQWLSSMVPAVNLARTSLALGLVLLGISIGLLIGLAQVFLTEAWVKVEKGFRAGRQLMLSREETLIGRAEGCDLGLFGDNAVERQHARILLKNNRYLLADAGTPGGTFLNDQPVARPTPLRNGDMIRVGNSVLSFGLRQKKGR